MKSCFLLDPDRFDDDNNLFKQKKIEYSCGQTIIDENMYLNASSSDYEIMSVEKFDYKCIKIVLKLKGVGCYHSVKFVDSGHISESNPPQRNVRIIVDSNGKCNNEVFTNTFFFDISNLKNNSYDDIILNFKENNIKFKFNNN
ncbi:hypothetical protein KRX57_08910 [Weeksellaceae bacterium TAE3-ERU29]|nr:hypothetical protein [Weeksellaceae bacterium TAE3-ERU29]